MHSWTSGLCKTRELQFRQVGVRAWDWGVWILRGWGVVSEEGDIISPLKRSLLCDLLAWSALGFTI